MELITDKKPVSFGMKATVIMNYGETRIYRNLTEIHYNPPSFSEVMEIATGEKHGIVAFESDIHHTGYTIEKSKIRDIEITLETEIANSI